MRHASRIAQGLRQICQGRVNHAHAGNLDIRHCWPAKKKPPMHQHGGCGSGCGISAAAYRWREKRESSASRSADGARASCIRGGQGAPSSRGALARIGHVTKTLARPTRGERVEREAGSIRAIWFAILAARISAFVRFVYACGPSRSTLNAGRPALGRLRQRYLGIGFGQGAPLRRANLCAAFTKAPRKRKTRHPWGGALDTHDEGHQPFFITFWPRTSAICTAFSAAPLRRLSDTHHRFRPFSMVES